MSWKRDPMLWERDKYFFHMSPQCCRIFQIAGILSSSNNFLNNNLSAVLMADFISFNSLGEIEFTNIVL